MTLSHYLSPDLMAGRGVFVTGGGSGINLGIAKAFASVGASVSLCGRTAQTLEAAAENLRGLGARVHTHVADVRDLTAVEQAMAAAVADIGRIDTVIAGAAGNFLAPAESLSSNGFRTVVEIDLVGSFHAARAGFGQLSRNRGSLLFVSAGQAYLPFEMQAHVGAAKAGVDSLMRTLALEWGRHGIRVNSIVPGPIQDTEGMRRLAELVGSETWTSMSPLGRFGTVDEVGAMAVVLASPLAGYVTGARVDVDGGISLSGSGTFNRAIREATAKTTESA